MATLFDILGLSVHAGEREVKKAYKELALKYHPDRKGGDPEMFKKVNEAYDILMDDEQREKYLTLLQAGTHTTVLDQFVRQQEEFAKQNNLARPSSKYERTCRNWSKGKCNNSNCMYRHYKTADGDKTKLNKVCHDYTKGYCRFGTECQFKHPGNLNQDDQSNWDRTWICNDIWRSCKAENNVLDYPRVCHVCGAKRKLNRCKFPPGTTVQLTGTQSQILEGVIKRTLFFFRDGIYKKQMNKLVTKMQQQPLHGQMVPTVAKFYPSAGCYHCVFQDGTFLIVPEKNLKRGVEKWTCEQCKYLNEQVWGRCALCNHKNPNPVQDWTPFAGTWKSSTGNYYIKIEEHHISSSDPTHYYTNLRLADGVLSYNVTLIEDDADDDLSSSDDDGPDTAPEQLGTVALRVDGKRLKGELVLRDGSIQKTTFAKLDATDMDDNSSDYSSSFDSRESTPAREERLKLKREDPQKYAELKKESKITVGSKQPKKPARNRADRAPDDSSGDRRRRRTVREESPRRRREREERERERHRSDSRDRRARERRERERERERRRRRSDSRDRSRRRRSDSRDERRRRR
eukprot:TRINITY_DN47881_c0_g1_i1.p1 TRINITY_DN47881_c0_g1~~TRINITY_DN47881_c0_g1_i1.p1  ORF type:complete len:593 (+),score=138.62 TRINITY_DN47881_c0_g1_i1:61-1779(+)